MKRHANAIRADSKRQKELRCQARVKFLINEVDSDTSDTDSEETWGATDNGRQPGIDLPSKGL